MLVYGNYIARGGRLKIKECRVMHNLKYSNICMLANLALHSRPVFPLPLFRFSFPTISVALPVCTTVTMEWSPLRTRKPVVDRRKAR